jgi:hypothetical protein
MAICCDQTHKRFLHSTTYCTNTCHIRLHAHSNQHIIQFIANKRHVGSTGRIKWVIQHAAKRSMDSPVLQTTTVQQLRHIQQVCSFTSHGALLQPCNHSFALLPLNYSYTVVNTFLLCIHLASSNSPTLAN